MTANKRDLLADFAHVREMAHRLLNFARIMPPESTDFCVGWTLAEMLCSLVEDQGDPADLAWLIEIASEFSAMLVASIREEHLAKSNAG